MNALFPTHFGVLDIFELSYRSQLFPPVCAVIATLSISYAFHLSGRLRHGEISGRADGALDQTDPGRFHLRALGPVNLLGGLHVGRGPW